MTFNLSYHEIVPGRKVNGSSVAFVKLFTVDSGLYAGSTGIHFGLIIEADVIGLETTAQGAFVNLNPGQAASLYVDVRTAGMAEPFTDLLLVNPNALANLNIGSELITLYVDGAEGTLSFRKVQVPAVAENGRNIYDVPTGDFASLVTLVQAWVPEVVSSGGSGGPGGADTQVQFNNAGEFAGSPNVTFDGTTLTADQLSVTTSVNSDLIPDGDATRDLGSATNKWRDLYLSNNSLYLGDAVLS